MYKIKSSFADCLGCDLFEAYSCILETNAKSFDEVEIIFIAENPGKTEVEHDPPIPLVGKAGQIFRKYFKLFSIDKVKYLLTNVVLCQTLLKDGKTGNPSDETIEKCKVNCFEIVKQCNPKLIVLMGTSPAKAFELLNKGDQITQVRGNMYKWNDYDILLTYHPSYVGRKREEESKFEADIKRAAEIVGTMKASSKEVVIEEIKEGSSGIYHYKIPDKYYTSDYKLVDVQYLNKTNEVLYIFRDKDNKKIYHKENDLFVCYKNPDPTNIRPIIPYEKLNQIKIPYRTRSTLDHSYYESDVKITVKHSQDYYLQKKEEEPLIPMNTMFIDIETLQKGEEFSTVDEANDFIAMIGYWYHDKHITYVLDPAVAFKDSNKTVKENCVLFKTERELVSKFISDLKELDPDIITGWYADGFDIPYIINRCKKLGINAQTMSRFGEVEIEYATNRIHLAGYIVLDLLFLYQMYTYVRQESYTLDFIGNLELGEGKLGKGYNFSKMFFDDPDEAIRYNQQDVAILPKLDKKLKHIAFQNEIRKVCKCDFNSSRSSLGQLDSLIVSFLKEKGLSSKASDMTKKDVKFEGAFVKEPIPGIHNFLVDLDATSLYPSTIITYNLGLNTFVMKCEDFTNGYHLAYDMDGLPEKINVIIDPTFEKKKITVTKDQLIKKIQDEDLVCTINGCFMKTHSKEKSFYSEILEFLLQSRKVYKKKMFEEKQAGNEEQRQLFDQRQNAMKILANSLYGILGNDVYRFFNTDLARAITLGGQELLKNCIVSSENFIKSIKTGEYNEPEVLTKQEIYTENFTRNCEHIITCDTDSLFVTFDDFVDKNKSDDEIVKDIEVLTNKVHTFINNNVIPKIIEKHNVSKDYSKLEFKNELVMKRGLFLAKKRYAVHVVSQEGVKCDDMVIKGIEVRRSDFPSYTKERLKELIEIILKGKNYSVVSIMDFVKRNEKEILNLIKQGNITVARPVSFTKKVEEYKVLSQGVKGMLNYNELEHKIFGKGSKAYLFKLKGIDLDNAPKEVREKYEKFFTSKGKKLDEIAIPEVLGKLPSYYIVDTKGMLKFSWTDRYSLLLGPMTPQVSESLLETF